MAVILHVVGQLVIPVAAIVDIVLQLFGVRRPPPLRLAIRPAKTSQRPDAGGALVIDNIVGITAGIAR